MDDALLDLPSLDGLRGDGGGGQVDPVRANERLRKEQGLEHADGGGADKAVELYVEVASHAHERDVRLVGEYLHDLDHVGGHDDPLPPVGDELG